MSNKKYTPLYNSIEKAKNDSLIPILNNGKTLESKYNPEREAENLLTESYETPHFFIVTGIMSGIFIQKLSSYSPKSFILCIERSDEDILFLQKLPIVKKLLSNKQIEFTSIENIFTNITNNYLPVKYGELEIVQRKPWLDENKEYIKDIQAQIQKAFGIVSADYSVQVHFGKIWLNNILNNLKILSKINQNLIKKDQILIKNKIKFNLQKTAYIIAAGPTLDSKINELKDSKEIFIISTDTAYSSLIKNKIFPDVVISIDGQNISTNHFMEINEKTLFLFDLCSNSSVARHIFEQNKSIVFFKSGHPLCNLVDLYTNNTLTTIFTGSGTVTIAALDFAIQMGFEKIKVLGADFGYLNGKPYTKGTYFDSLYNMNSNKIKTQENNFTKLFYRTELIVQENKQTSKILNAYRKSFEEYLLKKNCLFNLENNEYLIKNKNNKQNFLVNPLDFSFISFMEYLKSFNIEDLSVPLLPYIAYLKNRNPQSTYEELLKLAYSHIVSYNINYE